MLTRVENISIILVNHFLSSKGHIRLEQGKKVWEWKNLRMTKDEFNQFLKDRYVSPYKFILNEKTYWLFEGKFYKDNEGLRADEVKALLIARRQTQQARINRAKTIVEGPPTTGIRPRTTIPDDVKLIVWQRDRGKCIKCGSNIDLQYDHIIPHSKGGANTVANLQILCGRCNRTKGNSIV